jgi:hypothetical protein
MCKCITEKGVKCSREGKYDGYCFQHSKSKGGNCKSKKIIKTSPVKSSTKKKSTEKSVVSRKPSTSSEPLIPYDTIKYMVEMSDDYPAIIQLCSSSKKILRYCDYNFWQRLVKKKLGEKARKCLDIKDCQSLIVDYDILTKIIHETVQISRRVYFDPIIGLEFEKDKAGKFKYILAYGDDALPNI